VEVENRAARVAEHVEWARRTAAAHPTSPIAIVSNVVADCTEIATALAGDSAVTATHDLICLHSSLVAEHRAVTESTLLERAGDDAHMAGFNNTDRRPVIVVGTQVIQASLDFDVDFMATDLAAAPDILQRLGRAWRFEGSLSGVPFRGGRLPAGTNRSVLVVSVVGDDGAPTLAGTVPYLTAVLRRTHAELKARVMWGPLVDVFDFSQEWVDAAHDRDPSALLSEDEREQKDALDEALDATKKTTSASVSKASLGRSGVTGTTPLLPAPVGRKRGGARWSDLVLLTQAPDDEDLMRTRYIEHESIAVLLFDSTGNSFYTDPRTGQQVLFPALSVPDLMDSGTPVAVPLFARWRCVLPFALKKVADLALDRTLNGIEWKPKAKILASTPPLDLKYLTDDALYHPTTGLVKKDSR
jgi:hypothetical protein